VTAGAASALAEADEHSWRYLDRHFAGDWGDLDEHDRSVNQEAMIPDEDGNLGRILSVYTLPDGATIWIITEADRSLTTVLLPGEY
jgi:hypothetical protein